MANVLACLRILILRQPVISVVSDVLRQNVSTQGLTIDFIT